MIVNYNAFSNINLIIAAPLIHMLVKNLPAMWETWVRSLDLEDPLEKE